MIKCEAISYHIPHLKSDEDCWEMRSLRRTLERIRDMIQYINGDISQRKAHFNVTGKIGMVDRAFEVLSMEERDLHIDAESLHEAVMSSFKNTECGIKNIQKEIYIAATKVRTIKKRPTAKANLLLRSIQQENHPQAPVQSSLVVIPRGSITIERDEALGEGGFGTVYTGRYNGYPVAVKVMQVRLHCNLIYSSLVYIEDRFAGSIRGGVNLVVVALPRSCAIPRHNA